MKELVFESRTRVLFGAGSMGKLGRLAKQLGFSRSLLVADPGMEATGYTARARDLMEAEGITCFAFQAFDANPDSVMVESGRAFAAPLAVDSIVGLGGGSSLDCAKGINFVLTNGGVMADYWGYGKASKPMLPMIGIPVTAGTGSEAQSYTLISDPQTRRKMACGDPKAAFLLALLDPELCLTAPADVRATAGYDAISHAVETWVTTKRNGFSQAFSWQSWRLLEAAFPRVMGQPGNVEAMADMLLGSYMSGMAIEHSMLGATHACANPLTARYGTVHGVAIGLLLKHVVEWNQASVNGAYKELHPDLARRLEELAQTASLPRRLRDAGVERAHITALAEDAATQWTGRFNPRPFDVEGAKEVYECAW